MTPSGSACLGGQGKPEEDCEYFGDRLSTTRSAGTIRIGTQNVRGIGRTRAGRKNGEWRLIVDKYKMDAFCMNELNVDWRKVSDKDKLKNRVRGWWEAAAVNEANNVTEDASSAEQFGGTAIVAVNSLAHKVFDRGRDPSGLGRWSSLDLQGKNGTKLRIYSTYRPVRSSSGPLSVLMQHNRYFWKKDHAEINPRERMLLDLGNDIDEAHEKGFLVVVAGDWNEKITSSRISSWQKDHGLEDLLAKKHGKYTHPTGSGSETIDGIFGSIALDIEKGGICEDGFGISSDHRLLWIDLTTSQVFGLPHRPVKPAARRLKTQDPRVRKRYLSRLKAEYGKRDLWNRTFALEKEVGDILSKAQAQAIEKIISDRRACMETAESSCRKLRMGCVPWSPKLARARDQVRVWTLLLRQKRVDRSRKK